MTYLEFRYLWDVREVEKDNASRLRDITNVMTDILNHLHIETGNTMITVTHDVRCAEALCDKAIYIQNGVVAKAGGKELVREYFSFENI